MMRRDVVRIVVFVTTILGTALLVHLRTPIPVWAILMWLGMIGTALLATLAQIVAEEEVRRQP